MDAKLKINFSCMNSELKQSLANTAIDNNQILEI